VDKLLPGGKGDGAMIVTNPNSIPLTLTSAKATTADGASIFVTSGDPVACLTTNITFNQAAVDAFIGTRKPLVANGDTTLVAPDAFSLSASAPTQYQGMNFYVKLNFNATT
jgi:hypothetical protein